MAKDPPPGSISMCRLVNASTGDPVLYVDFPGPGNAVVFDCGELAPLAPDELRDVGVLCLSHHHMDHLAGFDRLLRALVDTDRTLHVYGPEGTIERIGAKLGAFAYARFPFMRLRVRIHEARFASANSDGDGAVAGAEWRVVEGSVQDDFRLTDIETKGRPPAKAWHRQRECTIVGVPVEHTVPCLAYVLQTKSFYRFERDAAEAPLRPGAWINDALAELAKPAKERAKTIRVDDHSLSLATLAKTCFVREPPQRVVFLTDAAASDALAERLRPHAQGADILYGDCYYSERQAKQADRHKHHTAARIAALARALDVGELRLMHFASRYRGRHDELIAEAREVFPRVTADVPLPLARGSSDTVVVRRL